MPPNQDFAKIATNLTLGVEKGMEFHFEKVQELLRNCNCFDSPTAVQALLSGLLAAHVPLNKQSLNLVNGLLELEITEDQWPEFQPWIEDLKNQLGDLELAFQPLLANEDQSQSQRLESLVIWTEHFISGFGLGIGRRSLSANQQELLDDLMAISQLDSQESEDFSEEDYLVVCEHVRIAVLQLSLEKPQAPAQATTH